MNPASVRQKLFLCKVLILIYSLVVAVLPLSDIHVEYLGDKSGFTADRTNHNTNKFNVYLHEILFSHFSKNSDQARTSSCSLVIGKINTNIFRANPVAKLTHLKNQDSVGTLLLYPDQTPIHISTQSNTKKLFDGFPSLYSGLSPPFV